MCVCVFVLSLVIIVIEGRGTFYRPTRSPYPLSCIVTSIHLVHGFLRSVLFCSIAEILQSVLLTRVLQLHLNRYCNTDIEMHCVSVTVLHLFSNTILRFIFSTNIAVYFLAQILQFIFYHKYCSLFSITSTGVFPLAVYSLPCIAVRLVFDDTDVTARCDTSYSYTAVTLKLR